MSQRQEFRLPATPTRAAEIQRVVRALERLPAERPFNVIVELHRPKRSDEQNRYLWGVVYRAILDQGGEALRGWEADDLHEFMLGECFGWDQTEAFGRKRLRPRRRSSTLNKQEFSDFISFVKSRAREYGIDVPAAEGSLEDGDDRH